MDAIDTFVISCDHQILFSIFLPSFSAADYGPCQTLLGASRHCCDKFRTKFRAQKMGSSATRMGAIGRLPTIPFHVCANSQVRGDLRAQHADNNRTQRVCVWNKAVPKSLPLSRVTRSKDAPQLGQSKEAVCARADNQTWRHTALASVRDCWIWRQRCRDLPGHPMHPADGHNQSTVGRLRTTQPFDDVSTSKSTIKTSGAPSPTPQSAIVSIINDSKGKVPGATHHDLVSKARWFPCVQCQSK